ncbi:flagellar hook-associated protein 2 [Cytobacillus suaedae]|nr:flagellar hook-associated protein 2 [Cytobacillus suaedae]
MRIGGLASGMDIDQLVSDLMKAERMPLDKLNQKKQVLEWQRDGYRDMNKLFAELNNMTLDMRLENTYSSKSVTSTNASAITATANADAPNGSYTVNVERLATAAIRASQSGISLDPTQKIDPNAKLSTQMAKLKSTFSTNATGQIEFTITTYNENGSPNTFTKAYDPANSSLNDILKDINGSTTLGVRAFYDPTSDKVVMERTVTGDLNPTGMEIGFSGASANFFTNTLQMKDATGVEVESGGTNARFTYNNGLTVEPPTNSYTINNISFTFNAVTNGNATVTISNNTDNAVDKIVQFVNKYNEVIEKINGKLSEERFRSYQPLTKEERDELSEKQIEQWEEKAKSGLLKNDSVLSSGLNQLRLDFYSPLSNTAAKTGFRQLAEIGIKTSTNYLDKGKLTIDEKTLRAKLQEDPDAVYNLFAADGTTTGTKGIIRRIEETITNTVRNIESKAGKSTWTNQQFTLGRNLTSLDKDINRFEDRLIQVEDRYWRQFTAMEKAIQQSNQQSMFLMQQFGGGM